MQNSESGTNIKLVKYLYIGKKINESLIRMTEDLDEYIDLLDAVGIDIEPLATSQHLINKFQVNFFPNKLKYRSLK